MKIFLRELKSDWAPMKYGYKHNVWEIKHLAKSNLRIANRELVILLLNLKSNILFCITLLLVTVFSVIAVQYSSPSSIDNFLETIITVSIGFVSVIVAGAVFITSQSNSSALREYERQNALIKHLNKKSVDIFKQALHQFEQYLDADQQWSLIRAHAAASVLDQNSYEKFADWFMDVTQDFEGSSYSSERMFPFTVARNASESRNYAIEEGIRIIDSIRNRVSDGQRIVLDSWTSIIGELKEAIVGSVTFSFMSSYSHGNFLGARLGRVIFATLSALFFVVTHKAFARSEFNLFQQTNFNAIEILSFMSVFICTGALIMCLRYIIKFIALLRIDSLSAPLSQAYFYARDPSEVQDQSSYYAHGL